MDIDIRVSIVCSRIFAHAPNLHFITDYITQRKILNMQKELKITLQFVIEDGFVSVLHPQNGKISNY